MRDVIGSVQLPAFKMEILNGEATLIFVENMRPEEVPEHDGVPGFSGWKCDRYTLTVPHDDGLKERVEARLEEWLLEAKKAEWQAEVDRFEATRDDLMAASDWTAATDSSLTPEQKAEWKAYRQTLRDIPETCETFPYNIVWPEMPSKKKKRVYKP
jgi:hypothetical protein